MGVILSFKEFGFMQHIKRIDDYPSETIAVAMVYTDEDLAALASMTADKLTKYPHHGFDGESISAEVARKHVPYADRIKDEGILDSLKLEGELGLVSMFATIGHASSKGRDIVVMFGELISLDEINPNARQKGLLRGGTFAAYDNNVLAGAQSFFASTHERAGSPSNMAMYAVAQPLALH